MSRLPAARAELRRDLLWLAVGAAALFVLFLGARDLWNPNEPIYGRAVVEMAERGEWLVPRVNGESFAEKPILYFLLARGAALFTGHVDEFSLRLPSALAGIVGVCLVYLLVLPYAGRRRGQIAGVLFATTYIVFWSSRSIQMDLVLTVCALGAILAGTRMVDHDLSPWRGYALAGLATGLAFLTKGPVGLIVSVVPVLAHAVATRRFRLLLHPALFAGLSVFVAVAAPWFLYLWGSGQQELLVEMLWRQNVVRSVDAWDHQAPWWYFLREFWNDMAPWSFFVPLALALPGRDEDERNLDELAIGWIVGIVLFFSIPMSKRSPYILPAAPAVAILVSGLAERLLLGTLGRVRRRLAFGLIAVFAVLFAAGGAWVLSEGVIRYAFIGPPGQALGMLLSAGGLAILGALFHPRRDTVAPLTLVSFVLSLYLLASGWVLPRVDALKSPRGFSEQVVARIDADRPVRSYGMWRWRAGYLFYMDRTIPRLDTPAGLAEYWQADPPRYLIVEDGKREEVLEVIGDVAPLITSPVGSKTVYLFGREE